jgi:hypothetical protein
VAQTIPALPNPITLLLRKENLMNPLTSKEWLSILFHLSNLPVKYNTLSYEILNSWIYSESESLTQRIKINSSDKNDVYESTDEICNFAEPSEVPSDGHGEILPNPTQVSFQDLPQENSQFTGLWTKHIYLLK